MIRDTDRQTWLFKAKMRACHGWDVRLPLTNVGIVGAPGWLLVERTDLREDPHKAIRARVTVFAIPANTNVIFG